MADGLYSDIESYMEGEGDPVEKDVKNEGNIPQGNASPNAPRQKGNIQSSDPAPEEPRREGNIESSGADLQSASQSGNIEPSGADPQESNQRGNIEQSGRQPQEPIRRPIEPSNEEPDGERSSNIPVSDRAPDPPQRKGNIQPRDVRPGDLQGEESIETNDRQPSEPRRRRNIRPDESNRPDNPNRVKREARGEATPAESQNVSRGASNDAQPKSPNRRVIRLREEAQPPSPRQEGNIKPTEEPPSTEPTESADITVGAGNQPPEEDTGRIQTEDRRPKAPRQRGNITEIEEDPQPKAPNQRGNITETEQDPQPKEPRRTENINPDEERRPASPNRQENINADEESRPDSPRRIENISPTEESQPKAPGRTENITPPEEPQPPNPNRSKNISPTEEPEPKAPGREGNITPDEDGRPSSPRRSENITPTEESEPNAPNRNENISPTEESEPKTPNRSENISPTEESEPKSPDSDGFIDPTEESEPKAPRQSGNISPTEESEPNAPNRSENISPTEESEPSEPSKQGNIDSTENSEPKSPDTDSFISPTEESEPKEPQKEGNINPSDKETTNGIGGEKLKREQPLKFQPARFSSQIDPENEEFVDTVAGKGDAVPEWEPPLKYQPAEQFAGQISNEGEFVEVVAGSRDGVAEWETPLKYQPPIIRAKLESEIHIDPSDEGGRYQLQKFVAGSNEPGDDIRNMKYDVEGVSEPARHVKRFYRFALDNYIIDPSFEGGIYLSPKFVAGSNEPGDNIRNMIYDVEGGAESLRHQPENIRAKLRNGTIINPDDEGGRYQLEQFVAGSNEPGDNVRNMKYDARGGEAPLRHQPPEIVAKLQNGTIINPADEGGRQQSENFVAGSDEPGGNIRNMGYDFDGADAELRHQILYKTALDNGVIDPSHEGGIYLSPKFVVGSNEPGDQLPDFPVAPFNAESSHSTQNNGPVLNPAFDTGAPKEEEFVIQNERVSEIVDGAYPGSEDGAAEWEVPLRYQPDRFANQILQGGEFTEIVAGSSDGVPEWETPLRHQSKRFADQIRSENSPFVEVVAGSEDAASEWEVPLRHQPKRFSNQINPEDGGVTDGVGGNFPRSSDGVIEANQREQFQTRFRGEIEDLNRTVRLQQFNDLFNDGQNNLSLFDSPPTLQGNAGLAAEPFVLRRPVEGGGSSAVANLKQGDSRTAPVGSAAEDVVRMSKFFSTAKALVYNVKQQFLQSQNPRTRTRLYDPTSPVQTAGSGMAVRPGQQITRHLSADSGPAGLVGDAASAIGDQVGFNVPQSSRYIDELNEEAVNTPWGDMRGSLFWLSPAANQQLPEATGLDAIASFSQIQSGNVQNIKPLFSTEDKDQLSQFAAGQFASQGGFGNGYLFTNTYDPGGGPNGERRKLTDNYHPSAPYIENVDSINSREEPTAEAHVGVQFNDLVQPLRDLTEEVRAQKESVFPFVNPFRTPETEDVVDGDGNVRTQIQNSSADDAYFENRAFNGEKIPMHRGVPQERQSRGLPNYSRENEGGQRTKRIDWINRLEPIVGEEADPNQETFGGGRHKDLIPFKFFDIENSGLIVFRAFLSSISDNLSPQWSQQDYAGRPEQAHIYGGYSNTISLSFDVVPFSEEEFEACWKKVNYLKGLTTPSSYSSGPGGNGSYMVPPFMRMTVGDLFNDVFGYMNSLTINFKDDVDWEIDQDVGRLPRGIEIDIDWQVIQKRAPRALQKFYDAPFLDEIDEVVTESLEPQPEILPQSADQPTTNADLDETRAEEFAEAPGEFSEPLGDGGPFERNANAFV